MHWYSVLEKNKSSSKEKHAGQITLLKTKELLKNKAIKTIRLMTLKSWIINYFPLPFLENGNIGLLNFLCASLVLGFVFIRGDFSLFKNLFWEGLCKVRADLLRYSSYNLDPSASSFIRGNLQILIYTIDSVSKGLLALCDPLKSSHSWCFCCLATQLWSEAPMATLRSKSHTPGNTVTFAHSVKYEEILERSSFTPQF